MRTIFTKIFGLAFGINAFLAIPATASVVYHDVNPDVTQTQTTDGAQVYLVDMNNDLTVDFTLSVFKGDTSYSGGDGNGGVVAIKCENGSAVAQSQSSPVSLASAYNAGDDINSGLSWQTNTSILRFNGTVAYPPVLPTPTPVVVGDFSGNTDKYLGVRFTVGANTYYGWIRVAVSDAGDSYTIKDWAYEDVAGTSISAGAGLSTAINKELENSTRITQENSTIEISFSSYVNGSAKVISITGAEVGSFNLNGENAVISLQGIPSGIYSMVFKTTSGDFIKKIFIQ